jgi:hypothetical protein
MKTVILIASLTLVANGQLLSKARVSNGILYTLCLRVMYRTVVQHSNYRSKQWGKQRSVIELR